MELELKNVIKNDIQQELWMKQRQFNLSNDELMCVVESIININYNEYVRSTYYADHYEKWYNLLEESIEEYSCIQQLEFNENDKSNILDIALDTLDTMIVPRSSPSGNNDNTNISENEVHRIRNAISKIDEKNKSLPAQRTYEWYKQRLKVLSASSIWKALFSEASKNSLIKDKLKDIVFTESNNYVSYESPLAWGQRFEPVAQMYYEYINNTTINEYGCIVHDTIPFLGASPDGINVDYDKNKTLYGRMLEIKCIVNREINGIPKKEYWVQMQLQMECCNLNECDFLECKFEVYENETQYRNDGTYAFTLNNQQKGMIMCYFDRVHEKLMYLYKPFHIQSYEEEEKWYNDQLKWIDSQNQCEWLNNIYWFLSIVSCVLVKRNREWFQVVEPEFEILWNEVLKQRKIAINKQL